MRLQRFSRKEKQDLKKILRFSEKMGIQIIMVPEEELGGAGGFYAADESRIYAPMGSLGDDLIVLLCHELGHAISESRGEVSKRQHEAYESYPEKAGDFCPEADAEIIRYIEARAIFYGTFLINELNLNINPLIVELDNLYTVLSLDHVLTHGDLTTKDIERFHKEAEELFTEGKTWDKLYLRFLV